jgi:glucose-6-phosphate isomerase
MKATRILQALNPPGRHHDMRIVNLFAQTGGKTAEQVKAEGSPDPLVPHGVFEGNRPTSTILAQRPHDGSTNALIRRDRRLRATS